uniref:RHOMBOID-like protein n=1 Tax=Nelumbo nucifera TaxID=4432 RepID=A0A822YB12_NELNU|nr:TPA_asm: hypothetical protein HUJ06_029683 [Nelumbo nucifera]
MSSCYFIRQERLTVSLLYVQFAALLTLIFIIVVNLAVGILPHVDNFAHIGGFVSGFLLGFVFLIRPQFGWINQRSSSQYTSSMKPKHKIYQYVLWILALILLVAGFTAGLVMLFRGVNANDHCSWCHYLSCIPTSRWSCKSEQMYCLESQNGGQFNLTCPSNGKSRIYALSNPSESQIRTLCTQLCT